MLEGLSILKIRVLIYLSCAEEKKRNVTHLATLFGVAKSTISRAVEWCVQHNMIVRTSERTFAITHYGAVLAHEYDQRRKILLKWLLAEGVPRLEAENDAFQLSLCCSQQTHTAIGKLAQSTQIAQIFRNRENLKGNEVCSTLIDGHYPVSYSFLYTNDTYNYQKSLLNQKIDTMGELIISNGNGFAVLKDKLEFLATDQLTIFYPDSSQMQQAERENENIFLSIREMNFTYITGKHILQGWIPLQLGVSNTAELPTPHIELLTMFL